MQRREFEGAGRADDEDEKQNGFPAHPMDRHGYRQAEQRKAFGPLSQRDDFSTVVPVGGMADVEDKQERGDELHKPHQPEIERVAGQVVDVPADGDSGHLVGDRPRGLGAQERKERSVVPRRERDAGRDGHGLSAEHHYDRKFHSGSNRTLLLG